MEVFICGILGGIVPAILMLIIYFVSFAGRFAKMENDICWLKHTLEKCLPPLKNPLP